MAITWGTIKSVLIFFGPILLPKAIAYYRSVRAAPSIHGIAIRPVPANVSRALTILFVAALVFFVKTFPPFTSPNLFTLTSSRLQIPTDVLFNRLQTLRPNGLTSSDSLLRTKFTSLESRLLYLQFGDDALTNCLFCTPEEPRSYFYYALTSILTPHLYNLCVLALVTSGLFTGKDGAIWRTTATISAVIIALLDVYLVATYNYQGNSRALKLEEVEFFHWKMLVYRRLALAALDGIMGWLLFLSSTNRAFVVPPTSAERIEGMTRILDQARTKINGVTFMRNATNRDKGLRAVAEEYWVREGQVMGEVMEDRSVVDGVRNALENRINIGAMEQEAENAANIFIGSR